MLVEIGNKGLGNSWQAPFPGDVECVHCGGTAMPAVSIMEEPPEEDSSDDMKFRKGDYICNLPVPPVDENTTAPLWPHDATAFTIYLCLSCLKATALFNQG